jgi:hypothetical protein
MNNSNNPFMLNKISNDIKKIEDDSDDEFKFLYNYAPCNDDDAIWGNNNGPQIQKCRSDPVTYNLPNLHRMGSSCHSIWNNHTSRKLIVKDYC